MQDAPKIFNDKGDVIIVLKRPSSQTTDAVEGSPHSLSNNTGNKSKITDEEMQDKDDTQSAVTYETVHMKVSSAHLASASRYFQKMLEKRWSEGNALAARGLIEIEIYDFDPSAMEVIMNIIHNRHRLVPRQVTLEEFTNIAIVTDFLECLEVVELFADVWATGMEVWLLQTDSQQLVKCLCISWILRKADLFKRVSQVLQVSSIGPISSHGLPIPSQITDYLDKQRRHTISSVIERIRKVEKEIQASRRCNYVCRVLRYGILKSLVESSNLCPPPPYHGLSIQKLAKEFDSMDDIDSFQEVDCEARQQWRGARHRHCRLQPRLSAFVQSLQAKLTGLDMESDFSILSGIKDS